MGRFADEIDVRGRYEGVIPSSRDTWLENTIADVEGRLVSHENAPWLATEAALPKQVLDNARAVVARAVLRLYRNPGGERSLAAGSFSKAWSDKSAAGSGEIAFTDSDIDSLRLPRQRRARFGTMLVGSWQRDGHV